VRFALAGVLLGPPLAIGVAAPAAAEEALPAAGAEEEREPPPDNFGGRGLLDIQDPFPLASLHLRLPVGAQTVLDAGEFKTGAVFDWANTFATTQGVLVDAETYRLRLGACYALRGDLYLRAELALEERDGGVLDPLVDDFHDLVDTESESRDARPRNAYEVFVTDRHGRVHELDRGFGVGDLVLGAHWNAYGGGKWLPAVALEALMSLPTSTTGFGNAGVDCGAAVSLSKKILRRWRLHGVLGAGYLSDARTEGIVYERPIYEALGGIEFAAAERLSIVLQVMHFSPLLDSSYPSPLDEGRDYVALGLKWEWPRGVEGALGLLENIGSFDSTADIAFHFSLGLRF
jgi:hypothetical protein